MKPLYVSRDTDFLTAQIVPWNTYFRKAKAGSKRTDALQWTRKRRAMFVPFYYSMTEEYMYMSRKSFHAIFVRYYMQDSV